VKSICWHCGTELIPPDPPYCEGTCPSYDCCDVEGCTEPGCNGEVFDEEAELREALSVLSSKLGAGLGDESRSLLEYVKGIEWGIDHNVGVMQKMIDDLRAEVAQLKGKP
jgi:hypothetical protein